MALESAAAGQEDFLIPGLGGGVGRGQPVDQVAVFVNGTEVKRLAVSGGAFKGTGNLVAYAILADGKTADQGEAALKREIARFRDAPVSAAEPEENAQ